MSDQPLPIRSWGITTYSRRDWDARRPTGGSRWGRWHAFEDSNLREGHPGAADLLALCGRIVRIGYQNWHNGEEIPGGSGQAPGGLYPGMALKTVRRRTCQGCLRRSVEGMK